MYRAAIIKLQHYADVYLTPPPSWPEYYFNKRSAARWAASELITRLKKYESMSSEDAVYLGIRKPIWIINDFIDILGKYSEIEQQSNGDMFWFDMAREAVEDIKFTLFT